MCTKCLDFFGLIMLTGSCTLVMALHILIVTATKIYIYIYFTPFTL